MKVTLPDLILFLVLMAIVFVLGYAGGDHHTLSALGNYLM